MSDSTVSALPAASALAGTELFYTDDGTKDAKVTAAQIKTLAVGDGSVAVLAGKILSVTGTLTFTGADLSTVAFGDGGQVAYITDNLGQFAATTSAELAGIISDETGTGSLVFGSAPTLSAPKIAGATSGTTTLAATAAASGTLTLPAATDTLVGKATTDTLTNKTFDTAGAGNVLKINGTAVSDKTGTGKVVLDTGPTLVTPALGAATATSVNKVAITAPATSATLTIADGKTATVSNTLTLAGTDGSTLNVGAGGTLGTAALQNTGTSGATLPFLNGANTWSGAQTHSSTVAFSGTTNSGLRLNNLTTTQVNALGSPQAGMSVYDTTRGSNVVYNGNTSTWTNSTKIIAQSGVESAVHTGDLVLTTLATIAIPGGMLGTNGSLRITVLWRFTGTAGTKTLVVSFGGTQFYNFAHGATSLSSKIQADIWNRGATNSQVGGVLAIASFNQSTADVITAAIDTTASQNILLQGQLANAGDSIAVEAYRIEVCVP